MGTGRRAQRAVALLASVWLLLTAIVDITTPDDVRLAPLYAIAPLIACAALATEITAVFAVAAITLAVASGVWNNTTATGQEIVRLLDVALVGAAAVIVAGVRTRQSSRHARLSALAETAQRAILPTLPARTSLVTAAARYEAAGQDALVGGDLYDSYHCAAFSRVIVGDVRGKGVAAVEQAARVIRAFRQSAATPTGLSGVAAEMSAYLQPFLAEEEFVTALLVELRSAHQLTIVDCGHPPPLLVTGDTAAFIDVCAGLPLGWGETYEASVVGWAPGDRLLLYTDGLVEARNRDGEFLPLLELAGLLAGSPIDDALDALLGAVGDHLPKGGHLTDDLALVLLENVGQVDSGAGTEVVYRTAPADAPTRATGRSTSKPPESRSADNGPQCEARDRQKTHAHESRTAVVAGERDRG